MNFEIIFFSSKLLEGMKNSSHPNGVLVIINFGMITTHVPCKPVWISLTSKGVRATFFSFKIVSGFKIKINLPSELDTPIFTALENYTKFKVKRTHLGC